MRILHAVFAASSLLAQPSGFDRIQWTKFEDPNEKAFTMDVPQGWPVDGGMARQSALQVAPYLRMLAPDGSGYLVIGNPNTPSYAIPNKTKPRVGERFRPNGTGQVTEVQPYTPGIRYAQQFGQKLFAEACSALKFESAKERPDYRDLQIKQYGGIIPDANMGDHSAREDAGEAAWTCEHAMKPWEAHLIVVTHKSSAMCTFVDCIASWGVDGMVGYIVKPGKSAAAEQALLHMINSVIANPAWTQKQSRLTAAEVETMNRSWQRMEQTISHIERRQAAFSASFQAMDDAVSGIHEYHDSQGNPYWLDNTKTQWQCGIKLVGTTNDVSPGAGCNRLSR